MDDTEDRPAARARRLYLVAESLSLLRGSVRDEALVILDGAIDSLENLAVRIEATPDFPPRPIDLPYAIRHIFLAMPPGGEIIIRRDREG